MSELSCKEAFSPRRALSHGASAVRLALAPMWLGGLLMTVTDGCGGNLPSDIPFTGDDDDAQAALWRLLTQPARTAALAGDDGDLAVWVVGAVVAFAIFLLVVGVALFALGCWLHTGFIRLHTFILENARDDTTPLFSGKDRFWPMAGHKLVSGFSLTATLLVSLWPGGLLAYWGYASDHTLALYAGMGLAVVLSVPAFLYVAAGLYLGHEAVVLEEMGPVQALRRAWELAARNRFALLWFASLMWLVNAVSILGLLFCCIGVLATVPLARGLTGYAKTESFLLFTRGGGHGAQWALWRTLYHYEATPAAAEAQAPAHADAGDGSSEPVPALAPEDADSGPSGDA